MAGWAMLPADIFTHEQALQMRTSKQIVGVNKAHGFLHQLRASLTEGQAVDGVWGFTQEVVDLTDGQQFNWKGYLANHSDDWLEAIFGPRTPAASQGFYRFEARFLRGWDKNMQFGVKGTKQRRFDFVGFRDDGKHFRFHPGSSGETRPIEGNLQLWAIEDSDLAVMPERLLQRVPMGSARPTPPPAASQEYIFRGVSQHDTVSDKDGQLFLQHRVQAWEQCAAEGIAHQFTTNLTDGLVFAWDLFLARNPTSQEVAARGMTECWLVWVGRDRQRAGFYLRFRNGSQTVYSHVSKGWRCDDDMVEDINWAA